MRLKVREAKYKSNKLTPKLLKCSSCVLQWYTLSNQPSSRSEPMGCVFTIYPVRAAIWYTLMAEPGHVMRLHHLLSIKEKYSSFHFLSPLRNLLSRVCLEVRLSTRSTSRSQPRQHLLPYRRARRTTPNSESSSSPSQPAYAGYQSY